MEVVLLGDALEQLRTLEDESAYTCVTSPPYYNLRDYGVNGQIGTEDTPEEYISRLVDVFREVRRILRPDGTMWVNIGDSYATRSGSQPPTNTRNSCGHTEKHPPHGYKCKDLIGIPWMLAFALRADGWYLRQDVIWAKPNCMPESVRDRCTKSHEYIFLLSKSGHYYFDAEAISEPIAESSVKRCMQNLERQKESERQPGKTKRRNKRDVWTISKASFKGAHYAVFPEKLVEPCVLAGCPEGGTVLDPFTGSGTTGAVAKRLRRNFVGVEINAEYWKMAQERISSTSVEYEQLTI